MLGPLRMRPLQHHLVALLRVALVPWLLLGFHAHTWAAYATATAPAGFVVSGGGFTFDRVAANGSSWLNGVSRASAVVNVGGRAVTVAADMRIAANAGAFVGRALLLNPAGLAVGAAAVAWAAYSTWEYNEAEGRWDFLEGGSPGGSRWRFTGVQSWDNENHTSLQAACTAWRTGYWYTAKNDITWNGAMHSGGTVSNNGCTVTGSTCTRNGVSCGTDSGTVSTPVEYTVEPVPGTPRPATTADADALVAPLPDAVANGYSQPLPVGLPEIVPGAVPLGPPVPVPATSPQLYEQPVANITPYPTLAEPWRVNVDEGVVTGQDPAGVPDPATPAAPAPSSEDLECGLPGYPKCQIDETGTPTDPELNPATKTAEVMQPIEDFAANPTAALPTLPTLNWAFTLPTGCSAVAVEGFGDFFTSFDLCPFQGMFHDLMSVVWIMGGLFGAMGHFWRNVYSQG